MHDASRVLGEAWMGWPFLTRNEHADVRVSPADFTAFALLPLLIAALKRETPHIRVRMIYSTRRASLDDLESGGIHF
jgi:DNA-binding transcriptional LysR family regulator